MKNLTARACFFIALAGFAAAGRAAEPKPLKIYMLCDMEGVSGLFERGQAWFWEAGVTSATAESGRELLIADVNSAVAAALAAGAGEVIVSDAHHGSGNFRMEKMLRDPRVRYIKKNVDANHRWMPGLDESVDGFVLLGHHAKTGTPGAFLPHAWSGDWADFRINGTSVGEIGFETCYAGHWGVPLIMVQGDEAACREAETLFPGVVTAAVKRAVGTDRCAGPAPGEARALTAKKIAETIVKLRAGGFKPFKPALPMTVSLRMKTAEAAKRAAAKRGLHMADDKTVQARLERQADVIKWITGNGAE